jgi:uncharacterized protein (TIGR03000 family)
MKSIKMTRWVLIVGAVALLSAGGPQSARADWGSWGGSRGYSSHGSWGGSRGGLFNGSRGGPIRNLLSRVGSRHGSHGGSWGSHGSHGGYGSSGYISSRGYGSSGYGSSGYGSSGHSRGYYSASSGGSHGYYGSSGYSSVGSGMMYPSPGFNAPVYPPSVIPYSQPSNPNLDPNTVPSTPEGGNAPTDGVTPPGPAGTNTGTDAAPGDDSAILRLRLPADAVVYVNGKKTRTPGELRSYVSRNLEAGKRYSYEVRAEIERNGQTLARTKVVQLTAGNSRTLEFGFSPDEQLLTSLTLLVPPDAKVALGGVETRATGPLRYFSTDTLKDGEKWENYTVSVTVNRNGKDITQEKTVSLDAGSSVRLNFDFDAESQIAAK